MERVRVKWRSGGEVMPALRDGDVVAWDFLAKGDLSSGLERSFLLVELGIKLTIPFVWRERGDPIWYVDLASVSLEGDLYSVIDLEIDAFVPLDGRPYRTVDLDEFVDAIEADEISTVAAMDGLRRWQIFLDTHLHRFVHGQTPAQDRDVLPGWRDFPPAAIEGLARLPEGAIRDR